MSEHTASGLNWLAKVRFLFVVVLVSFLALEGYLVGDALAAWTDSPLLHNSNRFSCSDPAYLDQTSCTANGGGWNPNGKWTNGWGTDAAGAKYGSIDCATCHTKNAANIKRIKGTITAPNSPTDKFPIEAAGGTINFQSTSGANSFGDDNRADRSQSNMICEGCHSKTAVHRYNSSSITDFNHKNANQTDCVSCHPHKVGFKPLACDSCHGNPPTTDTAGSSAPTTGLAYNPYPTGSAKAGAHVKHATDLGYACTNCHVGYSMPQESAAKPGFGDISIGFSNFGVTTGSYTGQANVSYNNTLGTGTKTCAAVYCHGNWTGSGGTSTSPTWDGSAVACGDCHANPPTTGQHVTHVDKVRTIVAAGKECVFCHAGAPHVNGSSEIAFNVAENPWLAGVGYTGTPNMLDTASPESRCTNLYCHSALPQGWDLAKDGTGPTELYNNNPGVLKWDVGSYSCMVCHYLNPTQGLSTGSHPKHLPLVSLAGSCNACHNGYDGAKHGNHNVDVAFNTINPSGSYSQGTVNPPNNGYGNCTTTYCHGATSPTWGQVGATTCVTCHGATNNGDLSVSSSVGHAIHYNSLTIPTKIDQANDFSSSYAYGCSNCHPVSGMNGSHSAGPVNAKRAAEIDIWTGTPKITAYVEGAVGIADNRGFNFTNGTCTTVCHTRDGASGVPIGGNPVWNGVKTSPNCGVCHNEAEDAGPLWSAPHTRHINTYSDNTNITCNSCHSTTAGSNTVINDTAAARAQHPNQAKNVDFNAWAGGSWASPQCSNTYCHSNGVSGTHAAISWSGNTTCTSCHGGAGTSTTLSAAHQAHIGTNAADFGYTCDVCHLTTVDATPAIVSYSQHVNKSKEVAIPLAKGGTASNGGDYASGSCATTNCHGSASPTWATGATNGNCSACHGMYGGSAARDTNGDLVATDAQVGAHAVHLTPNFSKPVTCDQCHLTTVTNQAAAGTYVAKVNAAGHIDSVLPAEMTWGGIADGNNDGQSTPAPTSCATAYCHDASKIKKAWGGANPGTLAWDNPNYIDPENNGAAAADCDNCHGYPPAGSHVADSDCSKCHLGMNADDLTFTAAGKVAHVDGVVQASADDCTACHGADIDGVANGVHGSHTATATYLVGKKVSTGGYGGTGWYTTVYVSGKPNFGCGECHPAAEGVAHPVNGLNVDMNPAGETPTAGSLKLKNSAASVMSGTSRVSVTCNNIYCHSDAAATPTYKVSPNWYGGTVSGNCTECHGNTPTTNAHNLHGVGIHYDTLYDDDAFGLMATSPTGKVATLGADAAHGNSATADTIGCQSCHNSTVAVEYNSGNTLCGTCHSDTNTPATGNEKAIISATGSTHVNGQPDVAFASLSGFKSKAQIRSDIATVSELNTNWTRTNGYKAVAGTSHDAGKAVAAGWNSGAKTCSTVECHNGILTPAWTSGSVGDCSKCHTNLP